MKTDLNAFSKNELIALVEMYSKNCLAMDGVWFQSVEQMRGMQEAMRHDENAWRVFTKIEAERIIQFLGLPDRSGIAGLKQALTLRFNAHINEYEIIVSGNTLTYRTLDCRVQSARKRKDMPLHPCKSVGIIEYTYFAKAIDERFECEAVSCYPDVTDDTYCCAWKFTLNER